MRQGSRSLLPARGCIIHGMARPPEFLTTPPVPVMSEETFRPAVTGRRGVFTAWAGVASLAVLSVVMGWRTQRFPTVAFGLLVFFLLAAVFTSLGSSMDRRTSVRVSPHGLVYSSPLRTLHLDWDQVQEMRVVMAGQGWRLVIRGGGRQFHFRVMAPPEEDSAESYPAGIQEGEGLVALIRAGARLGRPERENEDWILRPRGGKPAEDRMPPAAE